MSDRYRYSRPRSPTYNPARASLPINISGWANDHYNDHRDHHHSHAIPTSRREIPTSASRNSSGTHSSGGVITTYKVKADPLHSASTRARRSSTLDSSSRPPAIITSSANRSLRPIIHSGGARPASPQKDPYRSSGEDYYTIPASSHSHGHGQRSKRYSATMDNADMSRLRRDSDTNRLRTSGGREGGLYAGSRHRPSYSAVSSSRRDDDYGDEGYGYTKPRDLVEYDLNNTAPRHGRRDSMERSNRPTSISGYSDVVPRSYDGRERGPPPSTRGFDRIPDRTSTWGQASSRLAPVDPVSRPAPVEPVDPIRRTGSARPLEDPIRRSNSARPSSMYHDSRDPRRGERGRDDYYEPRDDDRRPPHRSDTFDDSVEQRGFGIRTDAPPERSDRGSERRSDRDRSSREYTKEERDGKGRDALAAGLSVAGAALGLTAAKNSISNRDEEREERRRREYGDDYEHDPRKRRERDERDSRDLDQRDKERRYRDEDKDRSSRDYANDSREARDAPPLPREPRDVPPPRDSRDVPPPPRDVAPYPTQDTMYPEPSRDARDRPESRGDRDDTRRERRFHPDRGTSAIDSDHASDDSVAPRARRESRSRRESRPEQSFKPNDTMDLLALKQALNAKDEANQPPKIPPKEPISPSRGSMSRDSRDLAEVRGTLENDRRPRDLERPPSDERQLRVVSPPRDRSEVKPIKSILRQPKAAFPEDPSPVREGVAPLKDAKKDGVPPDARWTKISRKLVNPEALEAGKERYEAREDFVIVLRVLSRDEVQGYAEITQRIRGWSLTDIKSCVSC